MIGSELEAEEKNDDDWFISMPLAPASFSGTLLNTRIIRKMRKVEKKLKEKKVEVMS
jgi:hypothetical protein